MKSFRTILVFAFMAIAVGLRGSPADSLINVLNTHDLTVDEKLETYSNICNAFAKYDYVSLRGYAQEGIAFAKKHKNDALTARMRTWAGVAYMFLDEHEKAREYFDRALEEARKENNLQLEGLIYGSIADMLNRQANFEEAIEYYLKGARINEVIGDRQSKVKYLNNIATLHLRLNNIDRAYDYLIEAEAIVEEIDYPYGIVGVSYNLGYIYFKRGDYKKALDYEIKCLETSVLINDKYFEGVSAGLLVEIYQTIGRYDLMEEYARRGVEVADQLGNSSLRITSRGRLAAALHELGRYCESIAVAEEGWQIDSTAVNTNTDIARSMLRSHIRLGSPDKALYFLNVYEDIIEKLSEESLHRNLLDMETKYETEKKQARINILEEEKRVMILIVILCSTVLLLAVALLIVRQRLNRQRRDAAEQQVKRLEQEKQLIATQSLLEGENTERTRLARDLHDGLGGMLSVVKINLKGMQNFAVMENPDVQRFDKALEILDQSIGELRRVAHHMMPDSLMRYGLKVALEDFCRAIPGASFHYLGEDPRLDNRLEVLIYRSAHELINNAVKHAGATYINIQLMVGKGIVALTVQDDGKGFDPEQATEGMGLANIRTRVEACNGKMNIYSSPGNGTEVSIEIET